MSEEVGGFELDLGAESGESGGEVTQEKIDKIKENKKKARQTRKQIVQQGKWDRQNAQLLSLLLKHIDDDMLIKQISHQLIDLKIDPNVIVCEFIPILKERVDITPMQPLFEDLWEEIARVECNSPEAIVDWFDIMFKSFDELQDMQKREKVSLLKDWCYYFRFERVEEDGSVSKKAGKPVKKRLKRRL